jgi:hypothetical protein
MGSSHDPDQPLPRADCGCLNAILEYDGTHRRECLQPLVLMVADEALPADGDGRKSLPAAKTLLNPTEGTYAIVTNNYPKPRPIQRRMADQLPEHAVVAFDVDRIGDPPLLWQRQADQLVPIAEDTYRQRVRQCDSQNCGRCGACAIERESCERRLARYQGMLAAVEGAQANLATLNALLEDNGSGVGDDYDLTLVDEDDLKEAELVAAQRLRSAWRILAPHIEALERKGR